MNKINWNFNNTYFGLPNSFKENINPVPVKKPELILLNKNLGSELSLDLSKISDKFTKYLYKKFKKNRPKMIKKIYLKFISIIWVDDGN